MMTGILFSLMAGALVSIQAIFNSKVNERAGTWSTTTLVLGLGFLASMTIGFILEGKQLFAWQEMQPWFWFSGFIGVGVVMSLVQAMKRLSPTIAIAIVMTSEVLFALLWDSLGWMGLEQVPFTVNKLLGVLVIIGGIFVLKFGGKRERQKVTEAA
ncbi:DMT family transporter [Paenibacillus algorifonticola]|uniref:DMT family transporter n=1 Tax=Paenibacillus algorifonticola TaxID=684063 RepID=UPI003D2737BF